MSGRFFTRLKGCVCAAAVAAAVVYFGTAANAAEPQQVLAATSDPPAPASPMETAFEAAQWAQLSSAGNALQQLGLRAAAGSPELGALVRQRQDLIALVETNEQALSGVTETEGGENRMVRLRGEIASLRSEIGELDARLLAAFPRYSDLASPAPLSIAEVQALLEDDESLLLALAGRDHIFVWAISKTDSVWNRTVYGAGLLADDIAKLRSQLDPNASTRGAVSLVQSADGPRVPAFDRTLARVLYFELIQPVERVLRSTKHVFFVGDGPLAGLPLSVLVASDTGGEDTDPDALRKTDWLMKRHAFTTLPSVNSLNVIRKYPPVRGSAERVPFAGFGAPVLGGQKVMVASAGGQSFFRGSLADVEAVRDLAPLPQTGPELRKLASVLGMGEDALYLGPRASEATVKQADLSSVDVLAFATHGLLSGDLQGLAEPALVLTPPETASVDDDGLLTASEVADLKLSADWVILSACNTAGGDGRPDAEGLSGLARAFLYAGARAILVSHWPVRDDAAARLTTDTLAALGKDRVRRSEALRQAMLGVMNDERDPTLAHPSAWAPFVIVGEGGY
ncbi:CHAT domain-containing protein [Mesorhizobium sp. KR9-304]|uniref:CHAT domain-containing protein n=1 Tax=Mesorhizobium sp. KR9-304 TaxID=3156614 RepID=UPI0032B38348